MSKVSERKRIRNKIVEILKSAKIPEVGDDVFSQRSIPTSHETLPVILVYQKSEAIDRYSESPKIYERNLLIQLEIITTDDVDDKLADEMDDLAQLVEDALEGTNLLNEMMSADGKCELINDYDLQSGLYDTESNGSNPAGSIKVVYNFQYYTNEDRPDSLNDFKSMKTQYNANDNTNNDAQDVVEFPQE